MQVRQANTVEVDALDVVAGDDLDAIDPIGPAPPKSLDFLKQPRAAGKRVPTVKNFSSNLCFLGMRSNHDSTTSTAPRFDVVLPRSASSTNLDDCYDLLPTSQQRADNRAPRPDLRDVRDSRLDPGAAPDLHHAVEDTPAPHHDSGDTVRPQSGLRDDRSLGDSSPLHLDRGRCRDRHVPKDVSLETHVTADMRSISRLLIKTD